MLEIQKRLGISLLTRDTATSERFLSALFVSATLLFANRAGHTNFKDTLYFAKS